MVEPKKCYEIVNFRNEKGVVVRGAIEHTVFFSSGNFIWGNFFGLTCSGRIPL